MTAYEDKLTELVNKLKELFQMDQADLDFGIYRVMKAKHDEIDKFLTQDLLPTVKKTLEAAGKSQDKQAELDDVINSLRNAGVDPDTSPKVQELKALLENGGGSSDVDAKDIFSNLITFFSRYYSGGDFMSLRRYKKDTYSPLSMNGEEVKLHWANADQYYIKSSENLTNYAFVCSDTVDESDSTNSLKVKFTLVAASTEQNNNKALDGDRVFTLVADAPFEYSDDKGKKELTIKFEYQVDPKKRKQKELNIAICKQVEQLTEINEIDQWPAIKESLLSLRPTKVNKKRTLLEKHLTDFTAKNKFDYFIHKDLGGFLNRELDYFIKNELIKLDDIIPNAPSELDELGHLIEKQVLVNESQLKKVIALKTIAQKIIAFLAQLENFQKKLWLKKKFVLSTNYCITLDKIASKHYPAILANKVQLKEWQQLFNVNITSEQDLKDEPYLVLDTQFFNLEFKYQLLSEIEELDNNTDGLLINSENFGALSLLQARYREQVKTVYIDPPYNTGDDGFLYKDGYSHSSWLSFMNDRLDLSFNLMENSASFFASIDNREQVNLKNLLNNIFHEDNFVETFLWTKTNTPPALSNKSRKTTEYIHCFEKQLSTIKYSGEILDNGDAPLLNTGNPKKNLVFPMGSIKVKIPDGTYKKGKYEKVTLLNDMIVVNGSVINEIKISAEFKWQQSKLDEEINSGTYFLIKSDKLSIRFQRKDNINSHKRPTNKIELELNKHSDVGTNEDGAKDIVNLGIDNFSYPKPVSLLEKILFFNSSCTAHILDYFAGSGTTGHAVINLNREDQGKRKYILVEMGEYFDTVTKPRIQKVIYSDSWKGGKPTSKNGISQVVKYFDLESYEDVLSNIDLHPTNEQKDLLGGLEPDGFKEQYILQYMLDIESKKQLIDTKLFESPLNAEIKVVRNNVTINKKVDLIETFNYLLGLNVATIRELKGIYEIVGTSSNGEKCLILWRDIHKTNNDQLDEWFKKQDYNSRDMEFDLIYVNGDNNLPNLKTGLDHWKVQLIDTVFYKLMFDVNEL